MENTTFTLKNDYKLKTGIKLDRNEKRRANHEVALFESKSNVIVDEFEKNIFNENTNDYNSLYETCLNDIMQLCHRLNKFSFKIISVNSSFFSETYKPLECN